MNTNRKAELQRKLSMTSVPTPPADLASKIKRDIPRSIGAARPAARGGVARACASPPLSFSWSPQRTWPCGFSLARL